MTAHTKFLSIQQSRLQHIPQILQNPIITYFLCSIDTITSIHVVSYTQSFYFLKIIIGVYVSMTVMSMSL
jgi:hypothetical protein